jgi:hypothetical protein
MLMLMEFRLHGLVGLDRSAIGRLMCRERRVRLYQVILLLRAVLERQFLL